MKGVVVSLDEVQANVSVSSGNEEVLAQLRDRFDLAIEEVVVAEETITFKLPAALHSSP